MLETIKSSTDISLLFRKGKRYNRGCVSVIMRKRDEQHDQSGRVAFIAGKKLGGAVWRNAAKRRMRAVCRDIGGPWAGLDVVFVATRSTYSVEYSKVLDACRDISRNFIEKSEN